MAVLGIEEFVSIDMRLFEWDKRYINLLYGQCRPFSDFPVLLSLYQQRRLKLNEMAPTLTPRRSRRSFRAYARQGRNAKGVLLPHG